MSVLFFFGAGASNGSLDCIPYCPPLGYQLFDELYKAGGIAASIEGELAGLFRQDFEKGMDAFFDERNEDTSTFLRDMAKYFAQFNPGPNNLYMRLIDVLRGTKEEVVFSTINYDLLIELAICRAGFFVSYSGLPVKANNYPVLKMHGSCNFLPALQPGQIKNVTFSIPRTAGILEAPVRPASTPQEVIEFCDTEDSVAPAIVMYARSKPILYCRTFIRQQQGWWQSEVYRAKRIFIIGAAVHKEDTHIWEPLAKSTAWLGYVGRRPDGFRIWATTNKRKRADVVAQTFEDAIPVIAQRMNRL